MASTLTATVHALARAHRHRVAELLSPHGLHAGQDLLLIAVWDVPGLRLSQLARQLDVEPPTVTRMVQRLERGGMLERRPDAHDGRATCIFPTPRSRLLESTVRRVWTTLEEELTATLGPADAERLQRLLSVALAGSSTG